MGDVKALSAAAGIGESRWQEHEKSLASSALAGSRADILVVPCQIENHGLDATSRSLITLSLAYRIANGTNLTVADPVLVGRALGEVGRSYSDDAVLQLASRLHVERVIVCRIGHDNAGRFSMQFDLVKADGAGKLVVDKTLYKQSSTKFDDDQLPYFSFLAVRDAVVSHISSELAPLRKKKYPNSDIVFPPDFLDDSSQDELLKQAYYLQALGVLHPENVDDRTRNILFERSLVLLEYLDDRSRDYALLKGRAFLYLNRRPVVEAVIDTGKGPAIDAFRAYANGNLPALEVAQKEIVDPLLSALSEIEAERLKIDYAGPPNRAAAESYLEIGEAWGPLFFSAMADHDTFRPLTSAFLKVSLDAAFPESGMSLETIVASKAATGSFPSDYEIAQALLAHIDKVPYDAESCANLAPCAFDYVDLLRDMFASAIIRHVWHIKNYQGQPDRAIQFAADYDALLPDHPALAIAKAWTLEEKAENAQGHEQSSLTKEYKQLIRDALRWTNRQTMATTFMFDRVHDYFPTLVGKPLEERIPFTFETDWPRPPVPLHEFSDRREYLRVSRHCSEYTIDNFDCFREYLGELRHMGQPPEELRAVLDTNHDRFKGHPNRLRYLASQYQDSGQPDKAHAIFRDAVDSGSREWAPYEVMIRGAVRSGEFDEAETIALKHPYFHDPDATNRVTLTNYAYQFGSTLYWAGASRQAMSLYQLAAAYGTGAEAEWSSRQRIALVEGDFYSSMEYAMQRIRRYDSRYALRDLIGMYAIVGDLDSAAAIVEGMDSKLDMPEPWVGALIEQRARNASADEIAEWSFAPGRGRGNGDDGYLALRHVFLANTIDRDIPESLPETLQNLDQRERPFHHGYGRVTDRGRTLAARFFSPDTRSIDMDGRLANNMPVDRRIVISARALLAIRRGEFEYAFQLLDTATHFYDLNELLPFYAWAAAKTGKTTRIQQALRPMQKEDIFNEELAHWVRAAQFDSSLASAFLFGVEGDHGKALEMLRKANGVIKHNESRLIFTRYQIIETARLLYLDTKETQYKEFALDLAQQNAVIEPTQAYTHSFVAMLSDDPEERITALARVLVLDPGSRSISRSNAAELAKARKLADNGYPLPNNEREAKT